MSSAHPHEPEVEQEASVEVGFDQLIDRFGHEIGTLRAQAIIATEIHKKAQEDWGKERDGYKRAIDQLSSRVAELESRLPATQGSLAGPKKATTPKKRQN
jgi:hypothetical protein